MELFLKCLLQKFFNDVFCSNSKIPVLIDEVKRLLMDVLVDKLTFVLRPCEVFAVGNSFFVAKVTLLMAS